MKKIIILSVVSVALVLGLGGCDRRSMGAMGGAGVGGVVGGLAGGTTGAVIGGVAGAGLGSHLSK
jgi:hypothetical protein